MKSSKIGTYRVFMVISRLPIGTTLWDEDFGEVYLTKYEGCEASAFPIEVRVACSVKRIRYSIDGYREDGKQALRLGKERDWEEVIRFNEVHIFDKVLLRNKGEVWHGGFFGGIWESRYHDINLEEFDEILPATKETFKYIGTNKVPELAFFMSFINDEELHDRVSSCQK